MDGEPASAAQAKRIAERNNVNSVAIHARTDSNEVRREETRSFLRGLCVQPLVFNTENGSGRGLNCDLGLRSSLCCGAEERRYRKHQTCDDRLQPQILMKIFLR
jgi:hypothetical protein